MIFSLSNVHRHRHALIWKIHRKNFLHFPPSFERPSNPIERYSSVSSLAFASKFPCICFQVPNAGTVASHRNMPFSPLKSLAIDPETPSGLQTQVLTPPPSPSPFPQTAPSYSPPAQRQTRGPAEPPQPYYPKPAGCFGGQARTYSIPPQQQDHFWDMAASMQQSGSWGGEGGGGRTGNSSPSRAQQSQGADANGYYSPSGTQGGYGNSYDSTQGSGEGGYGGGGGGWSRGPSSPQHERAIMLPPQRQDYQLGSSGGRVGFQGCNL